MNSSRLPHWNQKRQKYRLLLDELRSPPRGPKLCPKVCVRTVLSYRPYRSVALAFFEPNQFLDRFRVSAGVNKNLPQVAQREKKI